MLITDALMERFRLALSRRQCESTASAYLRCATECVVHLSLKLGRPVKAEDLTRRALQEWLDGLPHAPATITIKCWALLRLVRFIRRDEEGPAPDVQSGDLQIPEVPPRLPHFLTIPQAEMLMRAPLLKSQVGGYELLQIRDVAILHLLWSGGLRVSELVGLDLGKVQLDVPRPGVVTLRVLGKRKRERYIPLSGRAAQALRAYLDRRAELLTQEHIAPSRRRLGGPQAADQKAVFLSQEGTRLQRRRLYELVRRYGAAVGLTIWPHILRHTCATHLLAAGADLRQVQEFLGHSNPAMTAVYAHVDLDQLYRTCAARHPGARPQGQDPQERYSPLAREIADIVKAELRDELQDLRGGAAPVPGVCPDLGPVRCEMPSRMGVSP